MTDKPASSRALKAQETKRRVYEAARQLFGQKGYDNVGMDDIAAAADVSVGTCYHYFSSKYQIFQEVYRSSDRFFSEQVPELLTATTWSGKIIEFFSVHYGGLNESDGIELCCQLYVPTNDLFIRKGSGMQKALAELICSGQQAGELTSEKQPLELAEFLFVVARGVVFDWCLHHGEYDVKKKLAEHIQATLAAFIK